MTDTQVTKINSDSLPVVDSNNDPMLSMIERVCSDPNFDINKMQAIVDMRNNDITRKAKIKFSQDFAKMQEKMPRIVSLHNNTQTKSKYAKIEDINKQVQPILQEFGFGVSFRVLSQDKEGVSVKAILMHESGYEESTDLYMPFDNKGAQGTVNKTMIHATGSTVTYAKRYAMCMLLNISTGDDTDGNTSVSNLISDKQLDIISAKLNEGDCNIPKFLAFYKVRSIGELKASSFEIIIKDINTTIAKSKAKVVPNENN